MLFVTCGSPASGKTTVSKKIAKEYDAIRFSFDEMGCLQHKELIPLVIQTLQQNKNVIIDALFTRVSQRKLILETTKDINCKRILIYMDTPLDECIRRNSQRPHPLPDFIVKDIYETIDIPKLCEGWDEIKEVKFNEIDFKSN